MFLFIYAASGPLHYSLHLHRAFCNNAGLMGVLPQSASEATRIVIIYQLCCQPDNKNRNPENFMAFYGHKILIIISYHFYGFL